MLPLGPETEGVKTPKVAPGGGATSRYPRLTPASYRVPPVVTAVTLPLVADVNAALDPLPLNVTLEKALVGGMR